MMQRRTTRPLLLCLTAVVALNVLTAPAHAVDDGDLVKNLTNKSLQVIPDKDNTSCVTGLDLKQNLITLTDRDRLALSTYPNLTELYLDENQVTAVPARFFTVVPHLRVMSLSRNNISCLDPEALFGLDVLTELDLSHNLLTRLPTELFRGIKSLQMLKLHENPWNCSCPLLLTIQQVTAANVSIGSPGVTCASPPSQAGKDLLKATAECYPSPTLTFATTNPQQTHNTQQAQASSTTLKTALTSGHSNEQTAVLGNTWKFTTAVVALALTTSLLIVCAIKGPSWYKLYHNYRHRRLGEDDGEDEDNNVTRGNPFNRQTFTFKEDEWQMEGVEEEEGEEVYYEDPYIRRDEGVEL